jgi:hypothetical protein
MSTGSRIALLAAVVVVAIGGLVIANGGSDKPAGPAVFSITVSGGKPAGGIKQIKVNKGDTVNLVVKSDVADEIHIHGYDFHKDVKAGGTVRFKFPATIDGSFEIELEGRKQQIAALAVEP